MRLLTFAIPTILSIGLAAASTAQSRDEEPPAIDITTSLQAAASVEKVGARGAEELVGEKGIPVRLSHHEANSISR